MEHNEKETEIFGTGFDSSKNYKNLPLVVIAGRPNVGKSTLFNRLLHRRRAITDPTPGVTRDPIEETAFINGYPMRLMDTGGFKLDREVGTMEAVMDQLVVEQSLKALENADVILLLLDAGLITGEDEEFIKLLRPYWHKVIAAVNKTEGGRLEEEAWNYIQFGFDNLLLISAEHGDRIPELTDLLIEKLDFSKVEEGEDIVPVRIAIMGKPNTGKSTLANRLTHTEASIVCDYAGTTRDVVEGSFEYGGRTFQVLDIPVQRFRLSVAGAVAIVRQQPTERHIVLLVSVDDGTGRELVVVLLAIERLLDTAVVLLAFLVAFAVFEKNTFFILFPVVAVVGVQVAFVETELGQQYRITR